MKPSPEPLDRLVSKAVPLMLDNIDTDIITPIDRMVAGTIVEFAFEPLRFDGEGRLREDCALNDPAYAGAKILIAGANFGCGSSRETAVWAIHGMGFRAVIAASFGDIFFANCPKNGIVPIELPSERVAELADHARRGREIEICVSKAVVGPANGQPISFQITPIRQRALVEALDDLDLARAHESEISDYERRLMQERPWMLPNQS